MTRDEAKQILVELVESTGGDKINNLISRPEIKELYVYSFDIPKLFEELVLEKRIVEIEYILPQMDYRIKSILMPIETDISVFNANPIR